MNKDKYKNLSRGVSRDMSPQAVAKRLDIANQLYETAFMLGKLKKTGKVKSGKKCRCPGSGETG